MMYDIESVDMNVVKSLLWDFLCDLQKKRARNYNRTSTMSFDLSEAIKWINTKAASCGLASLPQSRRGNNEVHFTSSSFVKVAEAVWELVRYGIAIPTYTHSPMGRNKQDSYFIVTEYGMTALSNNSKAPCEPNSYLEHLKRNVPQIDEVAFNYARESIYTYNHDLLLSATTSIGAASEKSILLLIEAFSAYLSETERASFLKVANERITIKRRFTEFRKRFDVRKRVIEKDNEELIAGVDIIINGIFDLLRKNRNDTGHPTGKYLPKEEVFVLLQMFITYAKKIYALIEYFETHTEKIVQEDAP